MHKLEVIKIHCWFILHKLNSHFLTTSIFRIASSMMHYFRNQNLSILNLLGQHCQEKIDDGYFDNG